MLVSAKRYRLVGSFFVSFLLLLFLPIFFPSIRLTYFAPYLVIVCYRHSLLVSLWHALLCGVVFDTISSTYFFGMTSLQYCLTLTILYGQTRHFFEDKISTLPLMSALFAFISTLFQGALFNFFGQGELFSWKWLGTDLLIMPFLDACYAYLVFSLPFKISQGLFKVIFRRKIIE